MHMTTVLLLLAHPTQVTELNTVIVQMNRSQNPLNLERRWMWIGITVMHGLLCGVEVR